MVKNLDEHSMKTTCKGFVGGMAPAALQWIVKSDIPDALKESFLQFIRKFPSFAFVKMSEELIEDFNQQVIKSFEFINFYKLQELANNEENKDLDKFLQLPSLFKKVSKVCFSRYIIFLYIFIEFLFYFSISQ